MTTGASNNLSTILIDNFNRANNNALGNTIAPHVLTWQESETVSPGSISLSSGRNKSASTTGGREFAYLNAGSLSDYPALYKNSSSQLVWAINYKQTRLDPSGFDNNNYGIAFIIGKTTTDITTGNGYAVVIGQSGSSDPVRLAKFTGGANANSKFVNIVSGGDYANQYLSIKIVYNPAGNNWSLFVDSSSTGFPQSDPANTLTQIGSAADSAYTGVSLPYLGTLWNHATGASDSAVFDDVVIPGASSSTLNLTALIEGFYNTVTGKANIRDTVKVYLRNPVSPFAAADSAVAVLDSVTFSASFVFNNVSTGNYYIELKHRNCMETWSKLPQTITSGSTVNYNFTDSVSKAYGNNLALTGTKFCFFSGDVNQDGTIDVSDLSLIDNDSYNSPNGYLPTDVNGDYYIDASDISITENNAINTVLIQRP